MVTKNTKPKSRPRHSQTLSFDSKTRRMYFGGKRVSLDKAYEYYKKGYIFSRFGETKPKFLAIDKKVGAAFLEQMSPARCASVDLTLWGPEDINDDASKFSNIIINSTAFNGGMYQALFWLQTTNIKNNAVVYVSADEKQRNASENRELENSVGELMQRGILVIIFDPKDVKAWPTCPSGPKPGAQTMARPTFKPDTWESWEIHSDTGIRTPPDYNKTNYTLIPIKGDGNCGYYTILHGLLSVDRLHLHPDLGGARPNMYNNKIYYRDAYVRVLKQLCDTTDWFTTDCVQPIANFFNVCVWTWNDFGWSVVKPRQINVYLSGGEGCMNNIYLKHKPGTVLTEHWDLLLPTRFGLAHMNEMLVPKNTQESMGGVEGMVLQCIKGICNLVFPG